MENRAKVAGASREGLQVENKQFEKFFGTFSASHAHMHTMKTHRHSTEQRHYCCFLLLLLLLLSLLLVDAAAASPVGEAGEFLSGC